jgi:type II secretory pathway predicted ATPase ExeA
VPDTARFYPTAASNEALARIDHLVESGRRLGALVGESGAGKSLLLHVASRRLVRNACAVTKVDADGLTTRELLWQIAEGLAATPREEANISGLWRQIADSVLENRLLQVATVLFVDNAGQAGPDVLTQLMRLSRLEPTPAARWTMVLAAEPDQAARWPETLRKLVDLRIDLHRWEFEDTVGYVQTALVEAGRTEPLFDEAALTALHERSEGIPRRVAQLADYALVAGAAAGVKLVDRSVVEGANQELVWPASVVH